MQFFQSLLKFYHFSKHFFFLKLTEKQSTVPPYLQRGLFCITHTEPEVPLEQELCLTPCFAKHRKGYIMFNIYELVTV